MAFLRRQPWTTYAFLLLGWALLALLSKYLNGHGWLRNGAHWYPVAVCSGPALHVRGLPFLLAFLTCALLLTRRAERLGPAGLFAGAFGLLLAGNLGQGSFDAGFLKPFYESGIQYYHDALRIDRAFEWLSTFNDRQSVLLVHGRSHPPFAVLLHYAILKTTGHSVPLLALVFTALSALAVPLFHRLLRTLEVPRTEAGLLALLFAVLPAYNIYGGVSLDGVILTAALLFLMGLAALARATGPSWHAPLFMTLGLICMNSLTFGGTFLMLTGGLASLWLSYRRRRPRPVLILLFSLALTVAFFLWLYGVSGYDHVQAFLTASRLENPRGFRGFTEPPVYIAKRIEGLAELALFVSAGCLARLIRPSRLGLGLPVPFTRETTLLSLSGLFALGLMLACGAYMNGETGRGALFIFPILLLLFRNLDRLALKDLIAVAALQTASMQLLTGYFW